jgi:uncharacterized phiE125 gp8 family phage protein
MSYWGMRHMYGAIDSYGSLNLTQTSPEQSFVEPVTLAEMLSYLRIPPIEDDDGEANDISGMISAAREQAEILQGRDLVQKHWDLTFDYWPGYRIPLRAPLVSVDKVQFTDSDGTPHTIASSTGYVVDLTKQPGTISPPYNGTWPTYTPMPSSALLIQFTSGFSTTDAFWRDAGARIKIGMKLLVSAWYNNRIPFEIGSQQAPEYPYTVTSCLSYGSILRAR